MATYSFSYSVTATDDDVRAATPTGNIATVSGSHTHTPPALSPFTANLGLGGFFEVDRTEYSGAPEIVPISGAISITFTDTTWTLSDSASEITPVVGTFRTGTSGTVQMNVSWVVTADAIHPVNTVGFIDSGPWVTLGSEGLLQLTLSVEHAAIEDTVVSDRVEAQITVAMRYLENNSITATGTYDVRLALTARSGPAP